METFRDEELPHLRRYHYALPDQAEPRFYFVLQRHSNAIGLLRFVSADGTRPQDVPHGVTLHSKKTTHDPVGGLFLFNWFEDYKLRCDGQIVVRLVPGHPSVLQGVNTNTCK